MDTSFLVSTEFQTSQFYHTLENTESLQLYINQVIHHSSNTQLSSFKASLLAFKKYISTQYKQRSLINEGRFFFNDLFFSLSLTQLNYNLNHYLIFMSAITNVDLGPKQAKAIRIARDLMSIPASASSFVWDNVESLLLWISKRIGSSLLSILSQFREKIWLWKESSDITHKISALKLLTIYIKNFSYSLSSHFDLLQEAIIDALQHDNNDVQIVGCSALRASLLLLGTAHEKHIQKLCVTISRNIVSSKNTHFSGYIEAVQTVIDFVPKFASVFTFADLPIHLLTSSTSPSESSLQLVTLSYRCTPTLFKTDHISIILDVFAKLVRKRSQCRLMAMKSLGDFSFLVSTRLHTFHKESVSKLITLVMSDGITSEVSYALLSLLNPLDPKFKENLFLALDTNLESLVSKGIVKFCSLWPQTAPSIRQYLRSSLNEIIIASQSYEKKILALSTVIDLKYSIEELTLRLLIQYSNLLAVPNVSLKMKMAEFLLSYQNESIEISKRLVSFVCTESSDTLRLQVFRKILFNETSSSFIPQLVTLTNDRNLTLCFESLKTLLIIKGSDNSIKSIILDLVESMPGQEGLDKKLIQFMNHIIISKRYDLIPNPELLLQRVLSFPMQTSSSLQVICSLIKVFKPFFDCDQLFSHIINNVRTHSSQKRIEQSLNLLNSSLEKSCFSKYVRDHHYELIPVLFEIVHRHDGISIKSKVLESITRIGIIHPEIVQPLLFGSKGTSQSNSISSFIPTSDSADPVITLTYVSVATSLSILMDIIGNDALVTLHPNAIEALLTVLKNFRNIGDDLALLLVNKMKNFLENGGPSTISIILMNFASFIIVFGQKMSEIVPKAIDIICQNWGRLQISMLLRATEWIATSLANEFENHVFQITPVLLSGVKTLPSESVNDIFSVFVSYGKTLSYVDFLIIPEILVWLESHFSDTSNTSDALIKLQSLLSYCSPNGKYCNEIVRTLLLINLKNSELSQRVIALISSMLILYTSQMMFLLPEISQVINLGDDPYLNKILDCLHTGSSIPLALKNKFAPSPSTPEPRRWSTHFIMPQKKVQNSSESLTFHLPKEEWSKEEWENWCDCILSCFLKNSSSRAASACYLLSENHSHLKTVLFPVTFAIEILSSPNNDCSNLFQSVIKNPSTPLNILRMFLSAAELLELSGGPIPVTYNDLAKAALHARQFSQALRYGEYLFEIDNNSSFEFLIQLNQRLGLRNSASGIIRSMSKKKSNSDFQVGAFQFLGLWEDALSFIEQKLKDNPHDEGLVYKKMFCLESLSRYKDLDHFSKLMNNRFSASAAWHNGRISEFCEIMTTIPINNETLLFHSIVSVINNKYDTAKEYIQKLRNEYSDKIFPMLSNDFQRFYPDFVKSIMLTELEELIQLKTGNEIEKAMVLEAWDYRVAQISQSQEAMFDVLCIRSLYFNDEEMKLLWHKFVSVFASSSDSQVISIALSKLNENDPEAVYIKSQLDFCNGRHLEGIEGLRKAMSNSSNNSILYPKCLKLIGKWYYELRSYDNSLLYLSELVNKFDGDHGSYSILAESNEFLYEKTKDKIYLLNALSSYMSGLCLSPPFPMHFLLAIFRILFNYADTELNSIFWDYFNRIPAHFWDDHLLQITGKIGSGSQLLDDLLAKIAIAISDNNPNSVLFSLSVLFDHRRPLKSPVLYSLLELIKQKEPILFRSMSVARTELIKVASSWTEIWHYGIDEASRCFLHLKNPSKSAQILLPLHKLISSSPTSFLEVSFLTQFGSLLSKAEILLKDYVKNGEMNYFHQAWQYYTNVFAKLHSQMPEIKSIDLLDASPQLFSFSCNELSIPGTYNVNFPIIGVSSIDPVLHVFSSKQKPRRITIKGTDGQSYKFLLKANEDTRLDQRVMQLFSYINSIISTSKSCCSLTTYSILPISTNVGLIGWVKDCMTLYELLNEYRNKYGISLNSEMMATYKVAPNYDTIPPSQKERAFIIGLRATKGDDLKKILLINSNDSSHWLSRRILYTESLAATSMVGYVLGLGDRHLGNIMMVSHSSKLVHIDFGDCFEVASSREHFPETVPFRLTRLLVNALEAAGIDGNLQSVSVSMMKLLREHSKPIRGLMETFIYDPLLQFASTERKVNDIRQPDDILKRISDKLAGLDFSNKEPLPLSEQVDRLIQEAISPKNLCIMFKGWRPWW